MEALHKLRVLKRMWMNKFKWKHPEKKFKELLN